MSSGILKWLNYKYPQNFIIRNPLAGALILGFITFGFTVLYKPLGVRASRTFSIETTMALYSFAFALATFLLVLLVKSLKWFRDNKEWTILKEILSIIFVQIGTGVIIYTAGFFIEVPADRLNIATFADSVFKSVLISFFPFVFFSAINYYYLFPQEVNKFKGNMKLSGNTEADECGKPIIITSQLKKESLSFFPMELIYAESDGNYVIFYLDRNGQVKKEIIRNSINNIEQQLSEIPYFLRTHRAFIVNLKKVVARHGTTLGYRLKLDGTENKVPVSRNNTAKFNEVFLRN